jgi:hypothetical protein
MADIPRIKRNIQRMIAADAPEADIDAYVASEGVSLSDLQKSRGAAPEAKEPAPDSGGWLDTIATTTGGLIEGIPILGPVIRGGAERAAAATDAAFSDRTYEQNMEFIRQDRERMKKENPILDTGSQIVGAVASTLPVAATAAGAKALGIVGGNLAARTGAGAASGAAITGADALVRSGGDIGQAAEGAGIGGIIGGAVPVVGAGIGAGVRAAKAAASPAIQTVTNRIRPQGEAAALTLRALERDGLSIDDAATKLANMRKTAPDAVLADVAGANVRGVARAAVNTPGPQREAVNAFIEARNLAQPQRVTEIVGSVLKNPDDFAKTASRMAAERERIASPIYREAFKKRVPVNVRGVVQYIDEKVLPGVTGLADPLADLRPDGLTATLSKLRGFFATSKNQRFDLEQLHRIKEELDGMIGTAKRAGDDGKARAVLGVQNRLVQAMDKASPLYKKARGIYSNTYTMEEALETGRNIFRMRAHEVREAADAMTPAEREMMQVGVARAIADAAEGMRDGHDVVKRIFGTPSIRNALKAAFPDGQSFRRFQLALTRESTMRRTADAVRGNSTTTAQLADLMDAGSTIGVGRDAFSQLLEGKPVQAAASALRQALKGEQGINDKVAKELGDMLLSTDPATVQRAIDTLSRKQGALERIQQRINSASTYGSATAGQGARAGYLATDD